MPVLLSCQGEDGNSPSKPKQGREPPLHFPVFQNLPQSSWLLLSFRTYNRGRFGDTTLCEVTTAGFSRSVLAANGKYARAWLSS